MTIVSDSSGVPETASRFEPGVHPDVASTIDEYRDAYLARDVDRMVELFADDAELTWAVGTFSGRDAIRKVLEWDVRTSPTAAVRDEGCGVLVSGRTAVWERVVFLTAEGIPYEEPAVTVFELDEDGRIRRLRSYYDKLDIMHRIASGYPGVRGRVFRKVTGYLVAVGRKGLDVPQS